MKDVLQGSSGEGPPMTMLWHELLTALNRLGLRDWDCARCGNRRTI
jgi:hypothetical protein